MHIIEIPQKSVFGAENIDPDNDRAAKFVVGLRNLANRLGGRLSKPEFTDRTLRVSTAKADVSTGIIEFLRKRGVEAKEVELLDEFFAEASAQPPRQ